MRIGMILDDGRVLPLDTEAPIDELRPQLAAIMEVLADILGGEEAVALREMIGEGQEDEGVARVQAATIVRTAQRIGRVTVH